MDKVKTAGKSPAKAISLLLIGALGFAVALAWNDLFKSIMRRFTIVDDNNFTDSNFNEADAQELDLFDLDDESNINNDGSDYLTNKRKNKRKLLVERAKRKANQEIIISLIYAIAMTLVLLGVGWFIYKKYPSIVENS